ncbi:MAG: 5-(carboxyamino)imidazole ribonucleotide mutase [Candidatus Aminicenantia bacterium]
MKEKIAIFIGSDSDYPIIEETINILKEFEVPFILEITSAHRTPQRTADLINKAEKEGVEVFIAAAGGAAHLAGFIAAHTYFPVIGVPIDNSGLKGIDALLSTVQMPKGVPVATMGIGKSGAVNAAFLAIQILSLKNSELKEKLIAYRKEMSKRIVEKSEKLKEKFR